jgi:hypothetical protein
MWLVYLYTEIVSYLRHSPLLNFGFLFLITKRPTLPSSNHINLSLLFFFRNHVQVSHLLYPPMSSADKPITSFPLFCTLNSKTAYHIPQSYSLFSFSPLNQSMFPCPNRLYLPMAKSIFHPIIFLVLGVNQQLICSVAITVS